MGKVLVALDTDHIKSYVFGTDKLKEIRGASSLLDFLNREGMGKQSEKVAMSVKCVYANGGSGLFVVDSEEDAHRFGQMIQAEYQEQTGGKSSVTYAVQSLPEAVNDENLWIYPLENQLRLLQYRLLEQKNWPPDVLTLPSHPFIRHCGACGTDYAIQQGLDAAYDETSDEDDEERVAEIFFCAGCLKKYDQDKKVKGRIQTVLKLVQEKEKIEPRNGYLWDEVMSLLALAKYNFREGRARRPSDFSIFRKFPGEKDYMALIYADGNGMGKKIMSLDTLKERRHFARSIDEAVYQAMANAICEHLKLVPNIDYFPFDILLLGGDDIVMVVPATQAMDVALTITKEFRHLTLESDPDGTGKGCTLAVGVVLAPTHYPFGLLWDLAESTIKFAKKNVIGGEARINFMTVTGSTSQDFTKVYKVLHSKEYASGHTDKVEFHATLRPYDVKQLEDLLAAIRKGKELGLGRTKLHQLREAILKKNLTTSVSDTLALLRNWKKEQSTHIVESVYNLANYNQQQYGNAQEYDALFARVTLPWFASGANEYRTSLLDFVELYDFVAGESDEYDDEA